MNTSDLAKKIASTTELSEAKVKATIQALFSEIADAAGRGEETSIPGFGKFSVKDRPARQGRNPATGQPMEIAASKKVSFTPAKGLKDKL
ncbi:HU family DNA-binding protein [Sphingomonas sp. ABOLG]|jgi:DNA-binding protein HU-beta|uniref:HU family DNA-binding protein n=1 Tax=Sphingomonas sp. ABOLG TaxID=1985880 RepID=UPI000F7D918D|nr:HU family DNA-binding protein [Sphingomonas sp. ABOLG]RSV16232.1 HU family DNA-binding protein [Sphingomonas sp. ABOLG]